MSFCNRVFYEFLIGKNLWPQIQIMQKSIFFVTDTYESSIKVGSEFFYGKEGWRTFYFYKKVLRKVCLFSFDGLPWVFVTYSLFLTFFMLYPWDGDTSMFFAKLFLWSFFCYGLNLLVWRSAHVNIFLLLAFCSWFVTS